MRKSHIALLAVLVAGTLGIAGCSHVADDWKAAQAADTTEAYQDYLRQHPDSEFGVPAQERIKQLAENRDWQQAATADTLDAYQQFVAAHADGKWAQEARVRIENLQLNGANHGATPPGASPGGSAAAAGTTAQTAAAGTTAATIDKPAPTPIDRPPPAATPAPAATGKHAKPVVAPKLAAPVKHSAPASASASASASAAASGTHHAQLGAFGSRTSAEGAWRKLAARFPDELQPLQPHYVAATSHGKGIVRLQVGLGSGQQARDLCASLKKKAQPCVLAP
jgi:cell division protein FtsN